jgi:hypothetical protein
MRINRLRRARQQQNKLTHNQRFELILGQAGKSHFASDAERKQAWREHRDELLAAVNPTQRPWGYWQYEQGCRHPRCGKSAAVLAELGLLTEEEKRLIAKWEKKS